MGGFDRVGAEMVGSGGLCAYLIFRSKDVGIYYF